MRSILLMSMLLACQAEPINTLPIPMVKKSLEPISNMPSSKIVGESIDPPKPRTILLIGDSEVLFSMWRFDRAHVKKSNEEVFFDSKPGTTIGTWDYIFVSEMAKYPKVDEVLIFLGTNNFNFNFLQGYQNILNEVKRRNIPCIWVGPTEVYHKHHPINEMIKAAVIPTCRFFNTEEDNISLEDGVHPDLKGGIKWLQDIWQFRNSQGTIQ